MQLAERERKKTMAEDPVSSFCNALAAFCNHLHSSSDALKQSIDRRPIPLDSASSTFVQCLNRRVSTASADLDMLDSMSFGTVSFEELLGHCNELYKKNHSDLFQIQDRLQSYVSDIEEEDEAEDIQHQDPEDKLDSPSSFYGSLSVADSSFKSLEEDALLDESLSLKNFGLSDTCLAMLASKGDLSPQEPEKVQEFKQQHQHDADTEGSNFLSDEQDKENIKSAEAPRPILKILKSEFECLPAYMKGLTSWEDLLVAVGKINSSLSKKTNGCSYFHQDEIPSFELGPKTRSYLLLLVRMNRLVVETIDGLLSYRVL
ncbi:hypothetical protein AAZX31_03G186100 [Glycine max]|uniref:Uncharacterized protein n=1 Tax=Glycine max TaxID=3847 RepID=A0A0R0KS67_SOYBN|nr:uncharacterized protein LOC100806270 isoform X2 [Glycine max]KAH1071016.1 hypothetical protein GYH30_007863 [Glycine max]KRH68066.1 hypothetical protein GLYMA_03G206000v4 [Glycine max]|eukprot:XP_006577109.1 uncharacterized protein LOC100806270 isoform X2 [Glycine max]